MELLLSCGTYHFFVTNCNSRFTFIRMQLNLPIFHKKRSTFPFPATYMKVPSLRYTDKGINYHLGWQEHDNLPFSCRVPTHFAKGPFLSLPCWNDNPWGCPFPTNYVIGFWICVLMVFVWTCMFSIVRLSTRGDILQLGIMFYHAEEVSNGFPYHLKVKTITLSIVLLARKCNCWCRTYHFLHFFAVEIHKYYWVCRIEIKLLVSSCCRR